MVFWKIYDDKTIPTHAGIIDTIKNLQSKETFTPAINDVNKDLYLVSEKTFPNTRRLLFEWMCKAY